MMLDSGAFIVVVAVAVFSALWLWWRRPSQPGDRSLAMTVWAAFGPHDSAEAAGEALQRAVEAAMGTGDTAAHQEWIAGHTRKFAEWERRGTFAKNEALTRRALNANARGPAFEEAHRRYRDLAEAELLESMDRLNRELLDRGGHTLEAVRQPNGTLKMFYRQIWTDEDVERHERDTNEQILTAIGNRILDDDSAEAQDLCNFLSAVYETNAGKPIETAMDVGEIWFACLQLIDEEPDSEVVVRFKTLNEALTARRRERQPEPHLQQS